MLAPKAENPAAIGEFWRGLRVQIRCVHALMIRNMMMRYGRGNLGFLWVVIEPMILTIGVMSVWSLVREPVEHGIRLVMLVLTGYMPLTLWRHLTNNSVFVFRRNVGLLYHRNISLFDTYLAQSILEFAGTTAALTVVTTALTAAGLVEPPHDYGLMITAWLSIGFYAFGTGLVIASLTERFEVAEKFIQPWQYLMIPLSGTFFMVEWLPTAAQQIIWFNPSVHCYEMFRAGFFGQEIKTHFELWYPMLWGLGLVTVGLYWLPRARDRIHFG